MQQYVDRLAAHVSSFMGSPKGLLVTSLFTISCLLLMWWVPATIALMLLTTALSIATQITGQLIQGSQARQEACMQQKLDELIRALPQADNRLRGIEQEPR